MILNISDLSFRYREDILFRAYVLINDDRQAWKWYCNLHSNRKVSFNSLYKMHKSMKKHGQKTPVYVVQKNGNYYPADGATRLGSLVALGSSVNAVKISRSTNRKWREDMGVNTHHFNGIPDDRLFKLQAFFSGYNRI